MAGRTRTRRTGTTKSRTRRRKTVTQGRRSSARLGKRPEMKRYDSALDRPKRVKPGAGLLFRLGLKPYQAVGSVFLLLVILVITLLFQSPDFYVWDATVTGAQWLDPTYVQQMAGLDGLSIFYVNPGEVEEAIMRLPSVRDADVRCQLPGTVVIQVTERIPVAIWQSQDVQYWVDADGKLFERFTDMADPVIIVERDDTERRPGDVIDTRVLNKVLEFRMLLPDVFVYGYSQSDGLLFTANNRQIMAKADCDVVKVISALAAVEDELATRHVSPAVVDLRFTDRAFWR